MKIVVRHNEKMSTRRLVPSMKRLLSTNTFPEVSESLEIKRKRVSERGGKKEEEKREEEKKGIL